MFGSVSDDFDPSYWSRAAVAVLIANVVAVMAGTAWLLIELGSRILWFLLHLLLTWLLPPALAPALLAPPPITLTLVGRLPAPSIDDGVAVSLDDMGDPAWDPTPDPVYTDADLPPPPEAEPVERLSMLLGDFDPDLAVLGRLRDVETSSGLLAILGSSSGESGAIANLWSEDTLSGGELGGLIGAIDGEAFGSGGLGVGGLGARGTGGGGQGYGNIGGLGVIGRGDGGVEGGVVGGAVVGTGGFGGTGARLHRKEVPSLDPSAWDTLGDTTIRCRLQVTVDADGSASKVRVVSCPEEARKETIRAARASDYRAARDHRDEAVEDTITVTFVLHPPAR